MNLLHLLSKAQKAPRNTFISSPNNSDDLKKILSGELFILVSNMCFGNFPISHLQILLLSLLLTYMQAAKKGSIHLLFNKQKSSRKTYIIYKQEKKSNMQRTATVNKAHMSLHYTQQSTASSFIKDSLYMLFPKEFLAALVQSVHHLKLEEQGTVPQLADSISSLRTLIQIGIF